MKGIRAYLLFTSWRYRLGIFLGLPAAVLAAGLFFRLSDGGFVFAYLIITGIVLVETMGDQKMFNGIQSRRGYRLDFLKTSSVGQRILFQGLAGDLVRRLLTVAFCVATGWMARALAAGSGWAEYLGMTLAVYFAEVLALFISRFTRSVMLCLFIAYGCITVGLGLFVLVSSISAPGIWIADGLLALTAAIASVLAVRTGMRRWRLTYSDSQLLAERVSQS